MIFILIGILVACLIGTILYRVFLVKHDNCFANEGNDICLILISFVLVCTIFIGGFFLSYHYISFTAAENKIIIVEESNTELETEVAESVKQYIAYEGEELKALKPDTNNTELIAFAESYPNLQSSKLIQEQINTYKENKKKIVELKQSQEESRQTIKFWTFINVE